MSDLKTTPHVAISKIDVDSGSNVRTRIFLGIAAVLAVADVFGIC